LPSTLVLWRCRGQEVYRKVSPRVKLNVGFILMLVALSYSTRVQSIQAEMTDRAIELLALPPDEAQFILDIGCGSGLSGEILDEDGHYWVGCDVAPSMLEVALQREVEGDLFLQDIGQGFGFRPGTFDAAIR
jgi:18S rRNA (guanine1575-N7)-methyltransferase